MWSVLYGFSSGDSNLAFSAAARSVHGLFEWALLLLACCGSRGLVPMSTPTVSYLHLQFGLVGSDDLAALCCDAAAGLQPDIIMCYALFIACQYHGITEETLHPG